MIKRRDEEKIMEIKTNKEKEIFDQILQNYKTKSEIDHKHYVAKYNRKNERLEIYYCVQGKKIKKDYINWVGDTTFISELPFSKQRNYTLFSFEDNNCLRANNIHKQKKVI